MCSNCIRPQSPCIWSWMRCWIARIRGDLVLDSFLGSGTTLLAAERTGRICRGVELDPLYVDTAIRRWKNLTGRDATRGADDKLFSDIELELELGNES